MNMDKTKTFLTILGLGITIGAVLVAYLVFVIGARPKTIKIGGIEFEIPTSTPIPPSNNSLSQPTSEPSSTENDLFIASSPLIINGKSYVIPTSKDSPICVSSQETDDTSSAIDYDLVVPKGWVIIWDSSEAYWAGGSYQNNGLLTIYGNWQGKVTIVNGGYCAVPVEWKVFATYLRANASPKAQRPQFSIGEVP